jgi:hypothetical protein
MKRIDAAVGPLFCAALVMGVVLLGVAGEQRQLAVKEYEGQIRSIKIDKCGLQPGTCEGSVVLAQKGGGEVVLAIQPGTWIQRSGQLVTIDELGVGNYLRARAVPLPVTAQREGAVGSSPGERAYLLEETGKGD